MDMAAQRVQEQAGMAVMGMAMGMAVDQSAALSKLMEGAALPAASDPALGGRVDILA